jgi:tRNA(fMet)-specific endonuclease VapC
MILLDTDHFSVVADVRDARNSSLVARINAAGDSVMLPIVSVEEQLRGWLKLLRQHPDVHQHIFPYDRLIRLLETIADWNIVRWSEPAADEFKRLRKHRVRIGTQDLKIASIAIANDALLLSANLNDFQQVPGLRVEDWLYSTS